MSSGSGAIRAGRAFVELLTDNKGLKAGLDRAGKQLQRWGSAMTSAGMKLAAVGAGVLAPLAAASKVFATMGDQLAKASARTGVGVEALSALAYAAEQSGSDLEGLETGLKKMQKTLAEAAQGSQSAMDALANLGLSLSDLKGLRPDEQFKLVAEQVSKIQDPAQKAAAAMELFGKSGTTLIPLMEGGRAGIEELERAAGRLGLTMSTDTAKAAEEFGDRLDDAGKVVKMAAFNIGAALSPVLRDATVAITEGTVRISAWLRGHREVITSVGAGIVKVAAWAAGIGAATYAVGQIVGAFGTLSKVASLAIANPVVAVFSALAIAATAVGVALAKMNDRTAQTSDAMTTALRKADEMRELDQLRLQRLGQLAANEAKNNAEMRESRELIEALTGRYGDLGIALDSTTGKITGLAAAHEKMNASMKSAALAQIDAEISERQNNIRQLKEEEFATNANRGGLQELLGKDKTKAIRDLRERIKVEQEFVDAMKKRRGLVEGGDAAALTAPRDEAASLRGRIGTPPTAEQLAAKKKAVDAARQLGELEAQEARKRGDRYEQEIREIRETAAEKLRLIGQVMSGAQSQDRIDALRRKQTQTIADAEARVLAIQKQQTEEKKHATDELKKQLADMNGDRRQSAKLEADAFRAREQARVDALKLPSDAAKRAKDLIDEIAKGIEAQPMREARDFMEDLQRQALQAGGDAGALRHFDADRLHKATEEKIKSLGLSGDEAKRARDLTDRIAAGLDAAGSSASGTFNSAALQGLQSGPVDRIAKATEATAANTAKIAKKDFGRRPEFS